LAEGIFSDHALGRLRENVDFLVVFSLHRQRLHAPFENHHMLSHKLARPKRFRIRLNESPPFGRVLIECVFQMLDVGNRIDFVFEVNPNQTGQLNLR
jgi:hypothetical protein